MNRISTPRPLRLTVLLLMVVAFSVRFISAQWSLLPYNIDGLSEYRVADAISSTGRLDFPIDVSYAEGYVSDLPLLGLVIAFFSSVLGTDPLVSAQLITALLGAIAVSVVFIIFRRHWPLSVRGSIASALVLSLVGSFVFSAGCTWKETLGFVFLALALYALPLRGSISYRLLLVLSLLLSVFTHHHVTLVGFVIVTFAFVFDGAITSKNTQSNRRQLLLDSLTVSGAWALAIGYYSQVSLPYLDYLKPGTDLYLYLAVAFLMILLGVKLSRQDRSMTKLPIELIVPVIGAVLMGYNYFHPIFPGMPAPAAAILVPVMAYLILVVSAGSGAGILLSARGPGKSLLLAMLLGPLSIMLFGFIRSTDATSHLIIYRTFDFLMPAFAILVGLGFAIMLKNVNVKIGMAAGVSLIIICASTLPIAYDSQRLFGVQNQTYDFEYDAVQYFSEHGVSYYVSDQRLGETGWRLFDIDYGWDLPYALREGIALNETTFYVLEGQWTTNGAQEFPFGVVVVNGTTKTETLEENNVEYIGGPAENQLICFFTKGD